jgi:hypothetical protein
MNKISQEEAFLSSLDRGRMRVQHRQPGQPQWKDYTIVEAQRASEMIAGLMDIVEAMDREQRSM